jgi:hypothetical protein
MSAPGQATLEEQEAFLGKYWRSLMEGPDWETFESIVGENCVVHYPGNHFLSGDHVGRAKILQLYKNLYKLGVENGTFIGELHDTVHSADHCCALVKYKIVVMPGREIPGEAIGVFHLSDGQMVEYWLLERDQKMINDIVAMSGKASLAGASKLRVQLGTLAHPFALTRTLLRLGRVKRGQTAKML